LFSFSFLQHNPIKFLSGLAILSAYRGLLPLSAAVDRPSRHRSDHRQKRKAGFCAPQSAPRVINTDKNATYPKAFADLKAARVLPEQVELRQVKYLNNLSEQDHRFLKR
jgi:hypothetical protein